MNDRGILALREPGPFSDLLREGGFRVIDLPVTATRPVSDLGELEFYIERLSQYAGYFFTSPIAAAIFANAVEAHKAKVGGKIYVLGERAKEVFEKAGMNVEYRPGANTAREFIASFPDDEFTGKTYLFVRGERSMRTVVDMVGTLASVDEVVVYETYDLSPEEKLVDKIRRGFSDGTIAWACFFAPSAVDSFLKIFKISELNGIKTAAVGETTGQRIRESGLPLNFVSRRTSASDFAAELIEYIKKH